MFRSLKRSITKVIKTLGGQAFRPNLLSPRQPLNNHFGKTFERWRARSHANVPSSMQLGHANSGLKNDDCFNERYPTGLLRAWPLARALTFKHSRLRQPRVGDVLLFVFQLQKITAP
jgi:hypothetical protein